MKQKKIKAINFTGSFTTISKLIRNLGAPILISRIVYLANHFYQLKGLVIIYWRKFDEVVYTISEEPLLDTLFPCKISLCRSRPYDLVFM